MSSTIRGSYDVIVEELDSDFDSRCFPFKSYRNTV